MLRFAAAAVSGRCFAGIRWAEVDAVRDAILIGIGIRDATPARSTSRLRGITHAAIYAIHDTIAI
jgi:hypothetical protein